MSGLRGFKEFVASRGRSLDPLGVKERALVREDALEAVDLAQSLGVPILGGDVYVEKKGQLQSAYSNWYAEQREGEVETTFAARSCRESRAYISMYPDPPEGMPVFVLVTGEEGEH